MKVKQGSSKIVKPVYEGGFPPPSNITTQHIPLSVFDKITYDTHVAVIYAYRPPTPNNSSIEQGLQKALAEYREWAGRLGNDHEGNRVILLNDEGVKFVEASAECTLDQAMPFKPSPELLSLHPSLEDVEELVQVQLTRFTCGSLVIGFTGHHQIADAQATSNFLVAWGQACRGLEMNPCPVHDRTIFVPRDPPRFEFQHKEVEYTSKKSLDRINSSSKLSTHDNNVDDDDDNIVVHKVHFTSEFLAKLKSNASLACGNNRSYSTFESLIAHLWRTITKARGLNGFETTNFRISVNGRSRLNSPRVPNEYFGNLVLWTHSSASVKDLLCEPLSFAAKTIHDAITTVNDDYFKSFIDFSNSNKIMEEEDLIPMAEVLNQKVLCPNLDVDSWLRFPFYDLDLGGGSPYIFMPSYIPIEGFMFLLPSFILGDERSIDAFIALKEQNMACFEQICYSVSLD